MNFIEENWQGLLGVIGTAGAYVGGLKMRKQNEHTKDLENLSTIRLMEKQLIEDSRAAADELREIITEMKALIAQKDAIISSQNDIIRKQKRILNKYIKEYGDDLYTNHQ